VIVPQVRDETASSDHVTIIVRPALTFSPDWKIVPLDPRVPEGRCYLARVVGAAVPDHKKFEVLVSLLQNGSDRDTQSLTPVVRRDNYTNANGHSGPAFTTCME